MVVVSMFGYRGVARGGEGASLSRGRGEYVCLEKFLFGLFFLIVLSDHNRTNVEYLLCKMSVILKQIFYLKSTENKPDFIQTGR